MPILGDGWELHVQRLGLHASGGRTRTYGRYNVSLNGRSVPGLHGFVCECPGPGDNAVPGNRKRIEPGRYPLATHFGASYCTDGYASDLINPGALKMPGLLLGETGNRTAILVHPGHPPDRFLSSVGCLNLTRALAPDELMEFWESRARVIALIESLRRHAPASFRYAVSTPIRNAWVVIDGEPMHVLQPAGPTMVASHQPATMRESRG